MTLKDTLLSELNPSNSYTSGNVASIIYEVGWLGFNVPFQRR